MAATKGGTPKLVHPHNLTPESVGLHRNKSACPGLSMIHDRSSPMASWRYVAVERSRITAKVRHLLLWPYELSSPTIRNVLAYGLTNIQSAMGPGATVHECMHSHCRLDLSHRIFVPAPTPVSFRFIRTSILISSRPKHPYPPQMENHNCPVGRQYSPNHLGFIQGIATPSIPE